MLPTCVFDILSAFGGVLLVGGVVAAMDRVGAKERIAVRNAGLYAIRDNRY